MAAAACHIASTSLKWVDKFTPRLVVPFEGLTGGFTGDIHNVSSQVLAGSTTVPNAGFTKNESLTIGTKVQVVDRATGIAAVFIYGKLVAQNGVTAAAGTIVRTASYAAGNTGYNEAFLANDPDDWMWVKGVGPSALVLSAMTTGNTGFFLCGGKVPVAGATATAWGITGLVAATVKGLLDVASITGASVLIAGDHSGTEDTALIPPDADGQTPDALSFTVFTND